MPICKHPALKITFRLDADVSTVLAKSGQVREYAVSFASKPLQVVLYCNLCTWEGRYLPGQEPQWAAESIQTAWNHHSLVERIKGSIDK